MANNCQARSWVAVLRNPKKHSFGETPREICQTVLDIWTADKPLHTGAVLYCVSAEGLHHLHCIFKSSTPVCFSTIKKLFPSFYLEPIKGGRIIVEAYIQKKPPFDEKGEIIVYQIGNGKLQEALRNEYLLQQSEETTSLEMHPEP